MVRAQDQGRVGPERELMVDSVWLSEAFLRNIVWEPGSSLGPRMRMMLDDWLDGRSSDPWKEDPANG